MEHLAHKGISDGQRMKQHGLQCLLMCDGQDKGLFSVKCDVKLRHVYVLHHFDFDIIVKAKKPEVKPGLGGKQ